MRVNKLPYPENLLNVVMTGRIDGKGNKIKTESCIDATKLTDDQAAGLQMVIKKLPKRYRILLRERYEEGLTIPDLVRKFYLTTSWARHELEVAHRKLRERDTWNYIVYGADAYHNMLLEEIRERFSDLYKADCNYPPETTMIKDLPLPIAVQNPLIRSGIKTLQDLLWIMRDDEWTRHVRNVGEVKKKMVEDCIDHLV